MADDVRFEWVDGPDGEGPNPATKEEWERIDDVCATRGWPSLSRTLTRILLAKRGDEIIGFHVLQLFPHSEPLWVAESDRGTELAMTLADKMLEFLVSVKARGWMVIADSPFAEKLCRDRGMVKVKSPVYLAK